MALHRKSALPSHRPVDEILLREGRPTVGVPPVFTVSAIGTGAVALASVVLLGVAAANGGRGDDV